MDNFGIVLGCVGAGVGGVIALAFVSGGVDLAYEKTFGPAQAEVRRQTFEQSSAYRQGLAQEIQSMQMQYVGATSEQKSALGSIILHRTADVNLNTLPEGVQDFVRQLRSERGLR